MKESILITGGSGFLGTTIIEGLNSNYEVISLGRAPKNHYSTNLSYDTPDFSAQQRSFYTVIHASGKAHVTPKTEVEKEEFFKVNHQGTLNLLKGLESCPTLPKQFIFISTVAVYGIEIGEMIDEGFPLIGNTPYAESKILAEKAVINWCEANQVKYVILRLPLVVGKNAPGNLGAIKRAINNGYYFSVKNNHARKSAVLAEDVAQLISSLMVRQGIYNLTDGVHPSFNEIEDAIAHALGKKIQLSLPKSIVSLLGNVGDLFSALGLPAPLTSDKLQKMTATLTFDDQRAKQELGWQPKPVVEWLRQDGI